MPSINWNFIWKRINEVLKRPKFIIISSIILSRWFFLFNGWIVRQLKTLANPSLLTSSNNIFLSDMVFLPLINKLWLIIELSSLTFFFSFCFLVVYSICSPFFLFLPQNLLEDLSFPIFSSSSSSSSLIEDIPDFFFDSFFLWEEFELNLDLLLVVSSNESPPLSLLDDSYFFFLFFVFLLEDVGGKRFIWAVHNSTFFISSNCSWGGISPMIFSRRTCCFSSCFPDFLSINLLYFFLYKYYFFIFFLRHLF